MKYPEDFNIHSHLKKHHIEGRLKKMESGAGIDWGTAEALAIGSLLYQVPWSSPLLGLLESLKDIFLRINCHTLKGQLLGHTAMLAARQERQVNTPHVRRAASINLSALPAIRITYQTLLTALSTIAAPGAGTLTKNVHKF